MKKMKNVQMDSKVSFYATIYQSFWIGILKLTSGCPAYCRYVIFLPCMNKSSKGKRLASICNSFVEDAPNSIPGIILIHLPHFMNEMVWFKKNKTEHLVNGLDKFVQKIDVVIFLLIDFKGELERNQEQTW